MRWVYWIDLQTANAQFQFQFKMEDSDSDNELRKDPCGTFLIKISRKPLMLNVTENMLFN